MTDRKGRAPLYPQTQTADLSDLTRVRDRGALASYIGVAPRLWQSVVMRAKTHTIRFIKAIHHFDFKPEY
jgi:hypothetical protein